MCCCNSNCSGNNNYCSYGYNIVCKSVLYFCCNTSNCYSNRNSWWILLSFICQIDYCCCGWMCCCNSNCSGNNNYCSYGYNILCKSVLYFCCNTSNCYSNRNSWWSLLSFTCRIDY